MYYISKKKQRKKQVYDKHPKTANLATVQNYARRMQWKGNKQLNQTITTKWHADLGRAP